MLIAVIAATLAGFAAIIWLTYAAVNAPEGYEDDEGFHYGTEPLPGEEAMRAALRRQEGYDWGDWPAPVGLGEIGAGSGGNAGADDHRDPVSWSDSVLHRSFGDKS